MKTTIELCQLILRALIAALRSQPIVPTPAAAGGSVSAVGVTESQKSQPSGSLMASDVEVEQTGRELSEAIQKHMAARYGSLVTIDWLLVAENVMGDEDIRILHPAMSDTLTSWKAYGMTVAAVQHFHQVAG